MKTRSLLCAGLLAIGTTITLDSNRVIAGGFAWSSLSLPRNSIALTQNAKAEVYKRSGNVKFGRGDYQGAIADYTRAIELDPNFDKAYYNRGNAKFRIGNLSAAMADYDRSIEINPKFEESYYNRGNAKFDLGNYGAAIADFKRAVEINPNFSAARENIDIARQRLDGGGSEAERIRQHINRVNNARTCCR